MNISLIAALGKNRAIGKDNRMPWHLPADLKHFKNLTTGKVIIMGRKTFESIGKALPNRTNIVITRDAQYEAAGCLTVNSLPAALQAAKETEEVFIIGGATLYEQALPLAQRLYLTIIDENFAADTFFPQWDEQEWQEVSRSDHLPDENNPYAYSFISLHRDRLG